LRLLTFSSKTCLKYIRFNHGLLHGCKRNCLLKWNNLLRRVIIVGITTLMMHRAWADLTDVFLIRPFSISVLICIPNMRGGWRIFDRRFFFDSDEAIIVRVFFLAFWVEIIHLTFIINLKNDYILKDTVDQSELL
jgi:cytochrome c oxidase subunit IV